MNLKKTQILPRTQSAVDANLTKTSTLRAAISN